MKKTLTLFVLSAAMSTVVAQSHLPVPVCHKGRIIVVDDSAVPAHVAHGDEVYTCGENRGDR